MDPITLNAVMTALQEAGIEVRKVYSSPDYISLQNITVHPPQPSSESESKSDALLYEAEYEALKQKWDMVTNALKLLIEKTVN